LGLFTTYYIIIVDGKNWKDTFNQCAEINNFGPKQISLANINKLDNTRFVFPDFKQKAKATLKFDSTNKNLILSFDETLGKISHNLHAIASIIKYVEYNNCNTTYFKLPGEHVIESKVYNMELQFKCYGMIDANNPVYTMLVIPANFSDEDDDFFKPLANANEGDSIEINNLDSFINPFIMFNQIFHYKGSLL
jgi:hypothetical protein